MAIVFDAASNSGVLAATNTTTFSHTNNGNCIVVATGVRDDLNGNPTVTSVTYGGQSLTKAIENKVGQSDGAGNDLLAGLWYLASGSLPTGANNVVITWGANFNDGAAAAMSFSGVDTTNPLDATGSDKGTSASSPDGGSITTVANNAMIIDALYHRIGNAISVGSGQTQRANLSPAGGGDRFGSSTEQATAPGSYTMDWTYTGSGEDYVQAIMALKPAPTVKTQTGKARVTATTTKTQTGKARITATTPKTQTGKARIANTISSDTYLGQALLFPTNNNGGRISVANNAALNTLTAMTIEFWVYFSAIQPSYTIRVADKNGTTNKGFALTIGPNSQSLSGQVGNGTTQVSTSSGTLPLNQKTHVALTWDGSNVRLFIGGTKVGSDVALSGGNTGDDGNPLIIGNRNLNDRQFTGIFDEIRYSNIARYTSNFTPPADAFTNDANTIFLLHLDEGTGTSLTDSSSNGLTATVAGSTLPTWTTGFFPPVGFPHTGKSRITATTTKTQSGVANISTTTTTTKTQTGKSRITVTTSQTQSGKANIRNTTNQAQSGKASIKKTTTQTQAGLSRIQQTVNGFYYQNFASGSQPTNWQQYGNGTWTYNTGSVVQSAVGAADPNKLIYAVDFGQQITVQAALTIGAIGTSDDRIGITILGDSVDAGRGINLNLRNNNALQFLEDGVVWGPSTTIAPVVGETWIFKAQYLSGVFYGKAWKSTAVEPTGWMVTWTKTPASRYKYPGLTGNSSSKTSYATYTDFYVTTLPSMQGRTRITAVTPRTQGGKARVTATTTRTQTGTANIRNTTLRTQAGSARVTQTTPRSQAGISRVTASAAKTQSGKSRITNTVGQQQTGKARITQVTDRTQAGTGNIRATIVRTQAGSSRITNTATRVIAGLARVSITTARTIAAISRITVQTIRTQIGQARIMGTTARTATGISRITVTTTRTTSAQSRIMVRRQQPQAGVSRILVSVQETISGKARLTHIPTQTITGTAHIKSAWGISRKISSNDVALGRLLEKQSDTYYNV